MLAEDDVWIPYAVEVDGQMIAVFDPMVHKQVDTCLLYTSRCV